MPAVNKGFCVSGRTVRIETFEQLINFGRQDSLRFQKPTNAKPETVVGHVFKQVTVSTDKDGHQSVLLRYQSNLLRSSPIFSGKRHY